VELATPERASQGEGKMNNVTIDKQLLNEVCEAKAKISEAMAQIDEAKKEINKAMFEIGEAVAKASGVKHRMVCNAGHSETDEDIKAKVEAFGPKLRAAGFDFAITAYEQELELISCDEEFEALPEDKIIWDHGRAYTYKPARHLMIWKDQAGTEDGAFQQFLNDVVAVFDNDAYAYGSGGNVPADFVLTPEMRWTDVREAMTRRL
jgi:hypothetical protein